MGPQSINPLPCVPSDHDRFEVPKNRSRKLSGESWELVPKATLEFHLTIHKSAVADEIHPEGSKIHFLGRVVSDAPIRESSLKLGHQLLDKAGLQTSGDQPSTAFLMSDVGASRTRYYLVDHTSRTIRWVDGDEMPRTLAAADPLRAQNMLREEYWIHMENFPSPVPASSEDLHELKVVLASLSVDASTSDGSTSPFSPAQIQEFLATLNTFTGKIGTYETYTIARLWCMIWHARVVNNFGTPEACLDRFTILSQNPPMFTGEYARWMIYFIPTNANAHLDRCARAWAGRIAYVSEWRSFKVKNELEWAQLMWLACVLIIASLLSRLQSSTRIIPSIALCFGCASAANSYYLLSESQSLGIQAADASVHFQKWETARYGVQALALRNAAPRALLVWGFFIFILSIF